MKNCKHSIACCILLTILGLFCIGTSWGQDHKNIADINNKPDAALTETYWKLLTLNGQKITLGAGKKELHMILSNTHKVNGFSGCNRFMETFESNGNRLKFGPMAATMMMCAEAMDQEQAFLKALENAESYSINKEIFTLFDDTRIEILQFESVYLQ